MCRSKDRIYQARKAFDHQSAACAGSTRRKQIISAGGFVCVC
jgi:hypothetical protein